MKPQPPIRPHPQPTTLITLRAALLLLSALVVSIGSLVGCVVVGASSRGGFFVWPGGLGLVLLILVVLLLLRRR